MNSKPPKAKVYAREIIKAFNEWAAIQPPAGFKEYRQRVDRAEKKLQDVCKKHGLDSLRVIMDLQSS